MGMRKKVLLLALALSLLLPLCGCRTRTRGDSESILPEADESRADESLQRETVVRDASWTEAGETGEKSGRTKENPEASRKEYDENAPAEIVPGTDRLLHEAGEGDGASEADEESERSVSRVNEQAEEPAARTVAAQEADRMGVSVDAAAADSALTYFTVLLQDKMGSLYECQRLNVYWETAQDHVTVHKTSQEHAMILDAGCYDVSSRLLPENLTVDDGWVVRKNPGVIVKIVDSGVLASEQSARAMVESLRNREGWMTVDAVKKHRVLLLSGDLLEAPYLRTAAMVMIAGTANPELFADVDLDRMVQMLVEEATGTLPAGTFYYKED